MNEKYDHAGFAFESIRAFGVNMIACMQNIAATIKQI
jgi:hypothetical protein